MAVSETPPSADESQRPTSLLASLPERVLPLIVALGTVTVLAQVAARYLWGSSSSYEEIARQALIWTTFVGMVVCALRDEEISVDYVTGSLGPTGQAILGIFTDLVSISVMAVVLANSFPAYQSAGRMEYPGIGVPMSISVLALWVGVGLTLLVYLARLPRRTRALRTAREERAQ